MDSRCFDSFKFEVFPTGYRAWEFRTLKRMVDMLVLNSKRRGFEDRRRLIDSEKNRGNW